MPRKRTQNPLSLREQIAALRAKVEDARTEVYAAQTDLYDIQDELRAAGRQFAVLCERLVDHYGPLPLQLRVEIEDLGNALNVDLPPLYSIRERAA